MNDDFNREEALFEEAVKRTSEAERVAFLEEVCSGNADLRARLDLLLEGYFKAGRFLSGEPEPRSGCDDEAIGSMIGRYKLLEKIGEGGFGVVYLAEQKEPVKRRVALKVIKLGMDTKQVVARFEAERQALALMDHPNIAKVHDGGATEAGRPYFLMELVRGIPMTNYCEENQLSTRERLEPFLQVCQAVQHAHQKGIIHRDLKPSNILVTVNDGVAVPKVIDFGVAKATQQELTERTIFTHFHQFIGTPAYMSPEQAQMTSVDIDTRSDIYSLGVLLYELLTGKTPFDGKELLASGLDEMRRTIREKEPVKPSTRLARERAVAKSEIRNPKSEVDPDLDWIVMKCLEKERNRRYETANGLAADIQRHLKSEPVLARPPSAVYRFQKFARRNKVQFAAGIFALTVLILAAVVSSWQALRASRERTRAERRLQAIVQLMNETFENVVPSLTYTIGAAKPTEDLANAAVAIAKELDSDSEASPELRRVLGPLYLRTSLIHSYYFGNTTGNYAEGLNLALEAIRLFQKVQPGKHNEARLDRLAMAQMSAGFSANGLLRADEALAYYRQMRDTASLLRQSTNSHFARRGLLLDEYSRGLTGWTLLQMERAEEALTNYFIPLFETATNRVFNPDTADLQQLWDLRDGFDSMGRCYLQLGRREAAVDHLRRALEYAQINNRHHPNHAACLSMVVESKGRLGEALLGSGKTNEAVALLETALQMADDVRKLDPRNPGFVQLKVQVLRCHAAGYIAWAAADAGPASARFQHLEEAAELLNRADRSVARLKSESLRRFLQHDLERAQNRLKKVKAEFERTRSAFAPSTVTSDRR